MNSNTNPGDLTAIPKGSHTRVNIYDLEWKNKLAMIRVYETLSYFKSEPKSVDPTSGGEVVWRNVSCWDRIVIRDVAFVHRKPKPHVDFLHLMYSCELRPEKANQLHRISGSIIYNSVSKKLIASCDFIAASIGSFVIVRLFNNGDIHIDSVSNMYDNVIIELHKEFEKSISYLDQSKSPCPIRMTYEKYLHSDMSFFDLKNNLPEGSVLKRRSSRRARSPSRKARRVSPHRTSRRKPRLSVVK
uniref:Uncharacterized protein n=1 Tax=Pithovirus LCPAC401 TaxID=2506595 RepID=A0A481Z9W1_9VIRU|nr:MAG: uncharacterized protein LCPAC401_03220 [Pithovirus LCPAC401]